MEKKTLKFELVFVAFVLCLPAFLVVLSFLDQDVVFTLEDAPLLLFLLNPLVAFYLLKLKKWAYYAAWISLILFCMGLMYMFWVFYLNSGLSLEMWWHLITTNKGYIRPVLFFTTLFLTFIVLLRNYSLFCGPKEEKPKKFQWED